MFHPRKKELLPFARHLRKEMTKEERHLWYDYLRQYPKRFRRQEIIGNYIADFYCKEAALIVELDGSQHFEETGMANDRERTRFLESCGLRVLRFSNSDVNRNFAGVCEKIDLTVRSRTPQSPPRTALTAPLAGEPTTPQSADADSSPCRGAKGE